MSRWWSRSSSSSRPASRRSRAEETIEIFAFMEAADESKRQGGKPVDDRERDGQGQGRSWQA